MNRNRPVLLHPLDKVVVYCSTFVINKTKVNLRGICSGRWPEGRLPALLIHQKLSQVLCGTNKATSHKGKMLSSCQNIHS